MAAHAAAGQPDGFAQRCTRRCATMDAAGADVILVERPPQDAAWLGVNDRLRRAAHGSERVLDRLIAADRRV